MPNYPSAEELIGASDLDEKDIELESLGWTVRIRALAGAYSNKALSEAYEVTSQSGRGGRQEQTSRLNMQRLEELQVQYGLVIPKLQNIEQVRTFSQRTGRAWQMVVQEIQKLSGLDNEEIAKSEQTFRSGGESEEGGGSDPAANGAGVDRSDIPAPVSP